MKDSSIFSTLGKWVAGPKTRWITLAVWIVIVAVLSPVAPSVNKEENNSAALLPASSASVQAESQVKKAFPSAAGTPALLVWYRKGGLTAKDYANIQQVTMYLTDHPVTAEKAVVPLYKLPSSALQSLTSKDGTTLVVPVSFKSDTASSTLQGSLSTVRNDVQKVIGTNPFRDQSIQSEGLHARITGPVGIATDALGLFKNADFTLLAATTLLVLLLLFLLYRSPILAFVPLVSVGFAYGVISPLLGLLAKSGVITVDAQGISIMTVLLFGAGTDYCLFLVARFRERLHHIGNTYQAMREAVGSAAGAIAMSGLTVVLSLFTLLFARYGSDHRFAVPFSLAIFVMALAGVTLLPALLAILGRGSFFPFIPRTKEMWAERSAKRGTRAVRRGKSDEPGLFSRWIGRIVTSRPWLVVTVSVIILAVLASFSTQIKTTYNLLDSFPKNMPSRQGFQILANHFTPGTLAPVQVVVNKKGSVDTLKSDLKQLPFVQSIAGPVRSQVNPTYQKFQLTLKDDPYSNRAMSDIPKIQSTVEHNLRLSGVSNPAKDVWIAGETATQRDTQLLTARDTKVIIPIVVGIIAILLLLYLRSVIAMAYLIATVLLSYFSALGTGWLVLHRLMGVSAIQGAIPLYAFVFLVALGEDYNIFMVSRIWQERWRRPLPQAISEGVSRTSGVITSAGLILAGTFAVLSTLPIQVLVQFGIITAIGVLLDTFIVRPFVVPAMTAILGRVAFWPGKVPKTVEGSLAGRR